MTNARAAKNAREKAAQLRAEAARREARRRNSLITAGVVAVMAVLVGVTALVQTLNHDQKARAAAASAPPTHLVESGFLYGKTTAKIKVEIYEDFMCPMCGDLEKGNAKTLRKMADAGTVKLIYRPVAILDRYSSGTSYSTRALNAAATVNSVAPKSFEKFHDLLFANQPEENSSGLSDATLVQYAVQAGAKKADVESAITSQKYKGWVTTVTEKFSKDGYSGTPTVVVNGKQLKDWTGTAAAFQKTVETMGNSK
jgi:protein-disulfide isomerase